MFMDVAAIEVATDFATQVEQAIADSDVSLVVIGPNWLRLEDAGGGRRLDDPDDHVRDEVRAALESTHPVVPVLVAGRPCHRKRNFPRIWHCWFAARLSSCTMRPGSRMSRC